MNRHATYEVVAQLSTHVVIRDVGMWGRQLTVTNDAEWVVEQLECRLGGSRRLFYYDSGGELDELLVRWEEREGKGGTYYVGVFAGFKHCPAAHHREIPALIREQAI